MAGKLTHIALLSAALLGTTLLVLPAPEAPPSSAYSRHEPDDRGRSVAACARSVATRQPPGSRGSRNAFDTCSDGSDD